MEIVPKMCGRKISIYSIGLWWERKGEVYNICCYMPGNVFPTARAFIDYFEDTWHLILNETVSRQNLWEGNIAKYKTSEGNCALLPAILWRTTAVTARFSEFPSSKCPASGKIEITKYLFHLIFALFPIYFFTPSFSQLLFVPLLSCVKVNKRRLIRPPFCKTVSWTT